MKNVKGVLNVCSHHSDEQALSLLAIKELLLAEGFSFVCLAERADELTSGAARTLMSECAALSDERFCCIPGFSVSYQKTRLLMIGARKFVSQTADNIEDLVRWREITPIIVCSLSAGQPAGVSPELRDLLDGVEVWNAETDGLLAPQPRAMTLLDSLRSHHEMIATAGVARGAGRLTVPHLDMYIEECSDEEIMKKLSHGEFWCSNYRWRLSATESLLPRLTLQLRILSLLSIFLRSAYQAMRGLMFMTIGHRSPKPELQLVEG